ncbi:MAG: T9SS type A sorting domain-containing protein [Saprospiraceae bacterium]
MRTSLLFLVIFLFSYQGFAQSCLSSGIIFASQAEIDAFPIDYPNCTAIGGSIFLNDSSGDITNLDGLNQVTRIEGDFLLDIATEMQNFTGLENLSYIGGNFNLNGSEIASFEGLSSLDSIGGDLLIAPLNPIDLSGLENLTFIGNNLHFLGIDIISDLTSLSSLTTIGGDFQIDAGSFSSFEGLNNLTRIGGTFYIFMAYGLVDLSGLENLTEIGGSLEINGTEIESLNGLQNLQTVNGQVFIHLNYKLTDISALNNLNFESVSFLEVSLNDQLEVCAEPVICNYILNNPGSANFHGNGVGCQDVEEVILACDLLDLALIHYEVFYDLNQNKIQDAGEIFYPDGGVLIDPLEISTYNFSTTMGGRIYVPTGNYTVTYDSLTTPNWKLTTDSSSYFLNLSDTNISDTVRFGIYPKIEYSEMINIISSPPTRCDEWIDFEVYAKNIGTTTTEGTIWLEVDTNLVEVEFIDMPDSVGTNLYGWHFENLLPSASISKVIQFKIPGPLDFMLGDSLRLGAYITFVANGQNYSSRYFNYDPIVRCSYDPNDKLVQPNREGNYTLFEEDLFYTIRFQNTGNDVAYDVVILDTLDQNLDPTTFRVLSTSHPVMLETQLTDNRYLSFSFEDIFLPDSTSNFEGSQGYINYMISPKAGLAEETNIQNTASIYFDTNPPVVTNTTDNLMVSELPMIVSINPLENPNINFQIIPNPTRGTIEVFSEEAINSTFELRSLHGKLLLHGDFNQYQLLDLSQYSSGIYLISFQREGEVSTKKIVKY